MKRFLILPALLGVLAAPIQAASFEVVIRPFTAKEIEWARARGYRLGNDVPAARAALARLLGPDPDFETELFVIREFRLLKDYEKSWELIGRLQKTPAGMQSLELRKERIRWLMDREIYGTAVSEWNQLRQQANAAPVAAEAEHGYIHCLFKYAVTNKKLRPEQRQDYLDRAGKMVATIEKFHGKLPPEYFDLLKDEPLLQQSYETQKKELAAALDKQNTTPSTGKHP